MFALCTPPAYQTRSHNPQAHLAIDGRPKLVSLLPVVLHKHLSDLLRHAALRHHGTSNLCRLRKKTKQNKKKSQQHNITNTSTPRHLNTSPTHISLTRAAPSTSTVGLDRALSAWNEATLSIGFNYTRTHTTWYHAYRSLVPEAPSQYWNHMRQKNVNIVHDTDIFLGKKADNKTGTHNNRSLPLARTC